MALSRGLPRVGAPPSSRIPSRRPERSIPRDARRRRCAPCRQRARPVVPGVPKAPRVPGAPERPHAGVARACLPGARGPTAAAPREALEPNEAREQKPPKEKPKKGKPKMGKSRAALRPHGTRPKQGAALCRGTFVEDRVRIRRPPLPAEARAHALQGPPERPRVASSAKVSARPLGDDSGHLPQSLGPAKRPGRTIAGRDRPRRADVRRTSAPRCAFPAGSRARRRRSSTPPGRHTRRRRTRRRADGSRCDRARRTAAGCSRRRCPRSS